MRLTREAVYDLVWTEPMWTLAKRYGISDVGLAKICKKLRVPVPWRGYWARRQAGQNVRRTPLGKLPASTLLGMRIGSAVCARWVVHWLAILIRG